jgi:hypothetical protein
MLMRRFVRQDLTALQEVVFLSIANPGTIKMNKVNRSARYAMLAPTVMSQV